MKNPNGGASRAGRSRRRRRAHPRGRGAAAVLAALLVFAAVGALSTEPVRVWLAQQAAPAGTSAGFSGSVRAKSALLFDASEERVLYEKNAEERRDPASLTKILTAVTALECCDPDEVFEVGEELDFVAEDASRAGLRQGERLTVRALLDAMLLPSGNDAAYVLAVGAARRKAGAPLSAEQAVAAFCAQMNERAAQLGAEDSHFSSPDGYSQGESWSTAYDLLQITRYAMTQPLIAETVARAQARELFESGEDVTLQNTNALLDAESPYYLDCATGFKTGYTSRAGYCLISTAERDGRSLVCIVLGSSETGRWTDSLALLQYGLR